MIFGVQGKLIVMQILNILLSSEEDAINTDGLRRSHSGMVVVMVDESVHEEDGSDDEEKDENVKGGICQLLDQRMVSQHRDKSCAPSY